MEKITAGERRGLIVLIIILIAVTLLLCWRDYSIGREYDERISRFDTVRRVSDTTINVKEISDINGGAASVSVASDTIKRKKRGMRNKTSNSVNTRSTLTSRPQVNRQPREQRID